MRFPAFLILLKNPSESLEKFYIRFTFRKHRIDSRPLQ